MGSARRTSPLFRQISKLAEANIDCAIDFVSLSAVISNSLLPLFLVCFSIHPETMLLGSLCPASPSIRCGSTTR